MNLRPESKKLELTRDLFIFSCFTGLAYADVRSLKAGEIVRTIDGVDWIKTHRTKTKTKAKVKTEVRQIAQELVLLYQQRVTAEGHQFAQDTPWQAEMEDAFPFVETPDQHKAIVDMIAANNGDRAAAAMEKHINRSRTLYKHRR